MEKIDPKLCYTYQDNNVEGVLGHTESDYLNLGFCPCGEFCAHATSNPCNVIETTEIKESSSEPKSCRCQTSFCPCGDFVSHRVFEPCSAGEVKKDHHYPYKNIDSLKVYL